MKRNFLSLAAIAVMLIGANNASAQLSISVFANPFIDPSYVLGTSTSGIVQYTVNVLPGSQDLNFFQLEFRTSAFVVPGGGFTVTPVSGLGGGSFTWLDLATSTPHLQFSGLTNTAGTSLVFNVNYVLTAAATSNIWGTFGSGTLKAWEQPYFGVSNSPFSAQNEASKLASIPEPGTLLLLGSGLLGTGLVKRLRQRRNAKA